MLNDLQGRNAAHINCTNINNCVFYSHLQHDIQTRLSVSTEMTKNEEQKTAVGIKEAQPVNFREFEEELQEPEQKSVGDLSNKKVQKRNKELSKQNNQLAKSVDALKKEREELLSDKQKLKSENKTLERELRRVSSKGEVRLHKKSSQLSVEQSIELDTMEDMALKIQSLEARLAERDRKLKRVRERLQKINSDMPGIGLPLDSEGELSRRESQTVPPEIPPNGGILDTSMVERLLDERNKTSRLQSENTELKAKVASLEGSLAQMQAALGKEGMEKNRKRSGNFFRRNKAHSKSLVMKSSEDVMKERDASKERDTRRSRSPDFLTLSDSFHDMSDTLSNDPKAVGSLPNFVYSGLSPRTAAKRAHGDVQTLQSCLKLALDEKKSLSDQVKQLETELIAARDSINKERALVEEKTQALQGVKSSRDTIAKEKDKQLSTLQQTNERLKSEKLALEKKLTAEKDREISGLKAEIKQLETKLAESETMRKESEDVFYPPSTPQQQTPKREAKTTKSVVSKPPVAPTSQSKTPSKDKEAENKTRKTSQPRMRRRSSSSSVSSDEHYDTVANTRALFEQKIGNMRDDSQSPKRRKSSVVNERRGSYSSAPPVLTPGINHAKSSSFDTSSIVLQEKRIEGSKSPTSPIKMEQKSTASSSKTERKSTTSPVKTERKSTTSPVKTERKSTTSPVKVEQKSTTSPVKTGLKSTTQQSTVTTTNTTTSKPTSLNINKSTSGTKVQSFTSTNKETAPASKVSKIIVKSTASPSGSPVLGRQQSQEQKTVTSPTRQVSVSTKSATSPMGSPVLNWQRSAEQRTAVTAGQTAFQKQVSVPANLYRMSSSASTPGSVHSRSTSTPTRDIPIKIAKATTPSVKQTVIRSNSTSGSTATTPTSPPTTVTPAKVTISSTNAQTTNRSDTVVLRSNRPAKQRPQSMLQLQVPSSMKKAFSLQDIPEQTSSESTVESVMPPAVVKKTEPVVVQKNPTPRKFQRRERSDRPKTMYAGKAETTNLVNLISKFQQQEAAKKDKTTPTTSVITPISENKVMNGISSPSSTPSVKVTTPPSSSSGVVLRNSSPRAPRSRPNSYYGAPAEK